MTSTLGKLQRTSFTDGWNNELALEKWLVTPEGLALLGETLGVDDLDVVGTQVSVGTFWADIVLQISGREDSKIVIENQLHNTDHDHLGKMLTYAAGLGVRQVVWIAEKFRDEHRATLDWLNERTDSETGFTGLEIELWRIGASDPAPKFNVVSHVNEWSRSIKQTLYERYWFAFKGYLNESNSKFRKFNHSSSWAEHSIGNSFCHFQTVWHRMEQTMRTELYFHGADIDGHKVLDFIKETHQKTLDKEFDKKLRYIKSGVVKSSGRIALYRGDVEIENEANWPEYHAWYAKKLDQFDRVFMPIIEKLDIKKFPPVRIKDQYKPE